MTTTMRQAADDYIDLRRELGYRNAGTERYLRSFATWLDQAGYREPIPAEASLAWASATAASTDAFNPARRLTKVRGFLRHMSGLDGATDVPPPGTLGPTGYRKPPHIYTDAELDQLLAATRNLAGRLRPVAYYTLFALMACTGMRIGETLGLACGDVDLDAGVTTVRYGKRGRTRLVPLHPSAIGPLSRYAAMRVRLYGTARQDEAFFRTDRSAQISYRAAGTTFERLRAALGWKETGRTRPPRMHDLRHRMIVRRIQA